MRIEAQVMNLKIEQEMESPQKNTKEIKTIAANVMNQVIKTKKETTAEEISTVSAKNQTEEAVMSKQSMLAKTNS